MVFFYNIAGGIEGMTPVKVEGFLVFRHGFFASQCLNHGRAHADQEFSHVGTSIQAADDLLHTPTKSGSDSYSRKVRSLYLVSTPAGQPLNKGTLRIRFDAARAKAAAKASADGNVALSMRIREFQFRDIRPKAASEISNLEAASKLLGHTELQITKKVYRRIGEAVKPTR